VDIMEEEVLQVLDSQVKIETHKVDMVEVVAPYTLPVRGQTTIMANQELVALVVEVLLVEMVEQPDTVDLVGQVLLSLLIINN